MIDSFSPTENYQEFVFYYKPDNDFNGQLFIALGGKDDDEETILYFKDIIIEQEDTP